jgi:hypothetical protein
VVEQLLISQEPGSIEKNSCTSWLSPFSSFIPSDQPPSTGPEFNLQYCKKEKKNEKEIHLGSELMGSYPLPTTPFP